MARRANSSFDRFNPEFPSNKPHCPAVPAIKAGTQPTTPFFPDRISTTLGLVARRRFRAASASIGLCERDDTGPNAYAIFPKKIRHS